MQYLRGEWPQSAENLQRSIALAVSFGGTFGEVLGEQRLALTETAMGRYQPAFDRLKRALQVARASDDPLVQWHSIGRILTTLAGNRFGAGDLPAAAEYLAEGFRVQHEIGECPGCDVLLYPVAVPIYLALGQPADAEAACRQAEETALAFRSQAWTAAARYVRGLVCLAQRDWAAAAEQLTAARDAFAVLGQPYDAARAMEALGDVAVDSGAPAAQSDASALYDSASAEYLRLGAAGDAGRLARKRTGTSGGMAEEAVGKVRGRGAA